jgi:hypothetical protein
MVSPIRKKQISLSFKLILFSVASGVLIAMFAQLMIYKASEKVIDYMFMEDTVSFK